MINCCVDVRDAWILMTSATQLLTLNVKPRLPRLGPKSAQVTHDWYVFKEVHQICACEYFRRARMRILHNNGWMSFEVARAVENGMLQHTAIWAFARRAVVYCGRFSYWCSFAGAFDSLPSMRSRNSSTNFVQSFGSQMWLDFTFENGITFERE